MNKFIERNPNIAGGEPVFKGTRVPVQTLLDHLKSGLTISDFSNSFPTVDIEQIKYIINHPNDLEELADKLDDILGV